MTKEKGGVFRVMDAEDSSEIPLIWKHLQAIKEKLKLHLDGS